MKLIKYRDAGMQTYTYFWTKDTGGTISPFFDSEQEANDWLDLEKYKLEARGLWSDSCTTQREDKLATHEEQQEWAKRRNDPWDEFKMSKDIV